MSFVVAIRIQLEGDVEIFREMIMQYREDCLANESGMEQFLICSHQLHSQGADLQKLLQSMQEQNMRMEVMMMGGEEIESETQPILN